MREQLQVIPRETMQLFGNLMMLLLVVAIAVYLLLPQYKAWDKVSSRHNALQEALAQTVADASQIAENKHQLSVLNQRFKADAVNLNEQQLESKVVAILQQLAWAHAIELDGVVPRDGIRIGELQELQFDVELKGSYFDVHRMLQSLGKELDFAVVNTLQVLPDSNTDIPLLSVQLGISSYRLGET